MSSKTSIEPGVYRSGTGHTITITADHDRDIPIPEQYQRIASEEEFATGKFHPSALPGEEPEGWTPEGAKHGEPAGPVAGGVSEAEVAKLVADAVKKAQAESDKKLEAAVAKAVEAATK